MIHISYNNIEDIRNIRIHDSFFDGFQYDYKNRQIKIKCKNYYYEIAEKLGVKCADCIMVGNDVGEDMIAKDTGMEVFLVTDCLINRVNKDISEYPNGGYNELRQFLTNIK